MKNLKTPIAVMLVFSAVLACNKMDLQEETQNEINANASAKTQVQGVSESEWKSTSEWNAVDQSGRAAFFTTISAPEITADAAEKGLVRVFKLNGTDQSTLVSLPIEETSGANKNYWYYTVTDGQIMISVDVYGSTENPAAKSLFKYVVLNSEAVAEVEKKGTSKVDLMELPYEKMKLSTKK